MLEKAKKINFDLNNFEERKLKKLNRPDELEIIKQLDNFPDIIVAASEHREPHRLCDYAKELSAMFHKYYHDCTLINKRSKDTTNARIYLIICIKTVLAKCLDLIGVSAPKAMKKKKEE